MIDKETFFEEKKNYDTLGIDIYHLEDTITDPGLKEIDELYVAADVLSIKNAQKHNFHLKLIAIIAPLITFLFLIYDEAEQHLLIIVCIFLIVLLYIYYSNIEKEKCYEKYLEYRLLAEALRVQYYLYKAKIKDSTIDLLPWFLKTGVPLISDVFAELKLPDAEKKESILDCWIINQKNYHHNAISRTKSTKKRNDKIEQVILFCTIAVYIATFIFEIYMLIYHPYDISTANSIRACLKIGIGTASVAALFSSNYYGKLSLSNKITDHERMEALYEKIERTITANNGEEKEDAILFLAREFLIENSTWYAFQKKNDINFNVE